MKIEELMIGNLVAYIDGDRLVPVVVRKINGQDKIVCVRQSDGHVFNTMIDFLQPVPLTPEVLEHNGFKWLIRESMSITYCINEPTIHITFYKDNGEFSISVGPSGSIKKRFVEVSCVKYVHELQNALRLCKIEKEITLP